MVFPPSLRRVECLAARGGGGYIGDGFTRKVFERLYSPTRPGCRCSVRRYFTTGKAPREVNRLWHTFAHGVLAERYGGTLS
jgi:hypothetical protein